MDWSLIVFVVLMFGLFYLLFLRPARKRRQEHQKLVQELKVGDRVITAGGMYGVITSIGDESVVIRVESGATIRVAKDSVVAKRKK